MDILDLALPADGTTYITEAEHGDGTVLHLTLEGAHRLAIDGVEVTLGLLDATTPARLTLAAGQGGTMHVDQGLLLADRLFAVDFRIEGRGEINLDGGNLRSLTGHLATYNLTYSAGHTGSFNYTPPQAQVVHMTTFRITDMHPGDQFTVMGWTASGRPRSWTKGNADAIDVSPSYDADAGILQVHYTSGLSTTRVELRMTPAHAHDVMTDWSRPAARRLYWRPVMQGGVQTGFSFLFPGSVMCYGDGAMVDTPQGARAVETLCAGDAVICADGRARLVMGRTQTVLDPAQIVARADLRPIRITAGALADGYPTADLVVSPQHRIWVDGPAIRAVTGGTGGLIAVKHLLGLPGILAEVVVAPVRYHHLMLAEHEIITVNGILSESVPQITEGGEGALPHSATQPGVADCSVLVGRVARQVMRLYGRRREMIFENPGRYRTMDTLKSTPHSTEFAAE